MLYGKYQFLCCLENQAVLPYYKGSTFRGVFGHAMKKVVCALRRQECRNCMLNGTCVYTRVFETSEFVKPPDGLKIPSVPHPFVIEPPMTGETHFPEGSPFDFHLLLFGDIVHKLPYFIFAFDQMGKMGIGRRVGENRGQFALKAVKRDGRTIYSDSDQILKENESPESLCLAEPTDDPLLSFSVRITLETPLRFKSENRFAAEIPFHLLVRAMLRRVSSLFGSYGRGEPRLDYSGLVKRASDVRTAETTLRWFDWRRYSRRQEQEMLMGGIVGSVVYEGKIGEYMPLIELCTALHLGKQTSFGLGKISAEKI